MGSFTTGYEPERPEHTGCPVQFPGKVGGKENTAESQMNQVKMASKIDEYQCQK